MKTETPEHLKPRSQYAEDAVQLAIAGKWDDAVKLNKFIVDNFGADEETQNRLGKLRRYRFRPGRLSSWKKAIITLHADSPPIEFF